LKEQIELKLNFMNNFFDNQRILNVIWRRKFHFIIIGFVAIVLSGIFSGPTFIKPMFKSTARVYPTNNVAIFSEESETEQILEIINSNDLKRRVFKAVKLDSVYGVAKDNPQYYTEMFDIYNTNIKVSKTEYETVEIEALDHNPEVAKEICDSIVYLFNEKIGSLYALKYWEVVQITDGYLKMKSLELDSIAAELQALRNETGIISYSNQIEGITEGYMLSLSNNRGHTADGKKIKKQLDNLNEHGAKAFTLENKFTNLNVLVDSLVIAKEVALIEAKKEITYTHIVEHAFVADKKSYPVRWMIVAFSVISAIFFALLVFLVLDYRKED